jgi:hypothetical protein
MSFKRVSFILHYIRRLLKIAKMLYFYQKACRYIVKFVYKLRPWISISYRFNFLKMHFERENLKWEGENVRWFVGKSLQTIYHYMHILCKCILNEIYLNIDYIMTWHLLALNFYFLYWFKFHSKWIYVKKRFAQWMYLSTHSMISVCWLCNIL